MRHAIFSTSLALFATFSLPGTISAADLHVPMPYPTIQMAINDASNGDTVYLAPGVYQENISLNGKNITIRAFNTNFDTIIDGGQNGPVVTFSGTESDKCELRDLIIRNGKAAQGGGILGNSTYATIRKCTIGGNTATGAGGGVHGLSGLMKNCQVILNQAANGGGVAGSDGVIENTTISSNKATQSGGGVYDGQGIVWFSDITHNEALTAGGGFDKFDGFIAANHILNNVVTAPGPANSPASKGAGVHNANGFIIHNLIADNVSNGDGGGISNSPGIIQNNLIATNSARRGGGIALCAGRIENNTIWGNTAQSVGGGVFEVGTLVTNCIIAVNSAPGGPDWHGANVPTFSCIPTWTGGQPDILTMDPMLENPGKKKFGLTPQSPCIDAGRFIHDIDMDHEGGFRPLDGTPDPRGDGSDFDIGAYEFNAVSFSVDLGAAWGNVKVKYKGSFPKLKTNVNGQLIVGNGGGQNIDSPFGIQFFLSNDAIWDPGDIPVGKYHTVKKLKSGKSKKAKVKFKMPQNEPVTGRYLIGVADPGNVIAEFDENNNVAVYGPLP